MKKRYRNKLIERARRKKARWKYIKKTKQVRCEWCGTTENITIDHKLPKSQGGSNKQNNLRLLCRKCHNKRHKRDLNLGWFGNYRIK